MEKRLEKIEAGIHELYGKKKSGSADGEKAIRGLAGPGMIRCTLGRALLMLILGILGMLPSVTSHESESVGRSRNGSQRAAGRRNRSQPNKLSTL